MDNKELKELMEFITQSVFAEFEMEREGFKLRLVKDVARMQPVAHHNPGGPMLPQAVVAPPSAAAPVRTPAAGADWIEVRSTDRLILAVRLHHSRQRVIFPREVRERAVPRLE